MAIQIVCRTQVEQGTCQPCVVEVQFGCLDDAFVIILMIRAQCIQDETGLQYADPFVSRLVRHPNHAPHFGKVNQLADTPGANLQKLPNST